MEQEYQVTKDELEIRKKMCWRGYDHKAYFTDWTGYHLCFRHLLQAIRYGWGEGRLRDYWLALTTTKFK